MEIFEEIKEKVGELYAEHLAIKLKTRRRRDKKFNNGNGHKGKRTHWKNLTGNYADEELRIGPKYWRGQNPVLVHSSIRNYRDLKKAIGSIGVGLTNMRDYENVTGINRERLRLAQSWRDKGRSYKVSDIIRLSLDKIREELGYGKPTFGRIQYCKSAFV